MAALAIQNMTAREARECVRKINQGAESVRSLILDLYERRGWAALGYDSWQDCIAEQFGHSKSHMYRLLQAAKLERELSPIGDSAIPESHLRPLAILPPGTRQQVYDEATAEGPVTAARIQEIADKAFRSLPPEQQRLVVETEERGVIRQAETERRVETNADRSSRVGSKLRACNSLLDDYSPENARAVAALKRLRKRIVLCLTDLEEL